MISGRRVPGPTPTSASAQRAVLAERFRLLLAACTEDIVLLEHMRNSTPTTRKPSPRIAMPALSRSVRILGQMFEGVSQDRAPALSGFARWVTRLGLVLWGLVEIAIPDSLLHALSRRWISGLYVFTLLLLLAGFIFSHQPVVRLAWILLVVLATLHLTTVAMTAFIDNQRRWYRTTMAVGACLLGLVSVILIGVGVWFFGQVLEHRQSFQTAFDKELTATVARLGMAVAIAVALLALAASVVGAFRAISYLQHLAKPPKRT